MNALAVAVYVGCFAADGTSTHVALTQYHARERLLTASPVANDAIIGGQAAAVWIVTRRIDRPWLRWTVRLSVAGVHGAAAVMNTRAIVHARAARR